MVGGLDDVRAQLACCTTYTHSVVGGGSRVSGYPVASFSVLPNNPKLHDVNSGPATHNRMGVPLMSQTMQHRYALPIACVVLIACTERAVDSVDRARADSVARVVQDSINRTLPGYVVDSIRPIEEELRRFRATVGGDSAGELAGGANSRAGLVRDFMESVSAADTARLRQMMITPREFADLIYPESPYVRPPYRQAPGLVWGQIESSGATGLTRLLTRLGGQRMLYVAHECARNPETYGSNRIWRGCLVRMRSSGGAGATVGLFGRIVERDGHFKFVNYANDF